jgi:hypothetical protein
MPSSLETKAEIASIPALMFLLSRSFEKVTSEVTRCPATRPSLHRQGWG